MNPATTEGEWSKSSGTGLTTDNGFPVGAVVGTLTVSNGGRFQGQQTYIDYTANQWVRALTAVWNGTDGPWSDWINTATKSLRSTSITGNTTDLNTYNGPDYFNTYRMTGGTLALNYPYENFAGSVEVVQGYPGTAQQIAISNSGVVFTRQCSSSYVWSSWLDVGRQPRPTAFVGDANTLFDPGDYPTTTATTGVPLPSGLTTQPGGTLLVYIRSSGVYHQDFIVYGSNQTQSNRRFTRTYFNSWTTWREIYDENSLPILLGIGSTSGVTTQSAFDWQTVTPAAGGIYLVSSNNITNMPAGISFNAGTGIFIKIDGVSTSGTRIQYSIVPDTTVDTNYRLFKVLSVGAAGSRTFTVRQVFTNTDTISIANGGTGSTTAAGARNALELGAASTPTFAGLELSAATPFIDFHHGSSTADFTSRLITVAQGQLALQAAAGGNARFMVDGGYICRNGTAGAYHPGNAFNIDWASNFGVAIWIDSTNMGAVSFQSTSDIQLKKDIEYVSPKTALGELLQWKPATFKYKARGVLPESRETLGFIANDVITVSPECVTGKGLTEDWDENNPDSPYVLDTTAMLAKAVMAIQELKEQVDALKAEIASLKPDDDAADSDITENQPDVQP